MPEGSLIRVFEYERLKVGERGFLDRHWEALGRWAERQGERYLELWPGSARFLNWVGVIEVGDLVIEILPKTERDRSDCGNAEHAAKWSRVLVDLLREAGCLDAAVAEDARLGLQDRTLIDVLFSQYLDALERLLREGLVKRYRSAARERSSVKGRIDFPAMARRNPAHAERIPTVAVEYDRLNRLNLALKAATEVSALYAPTAYSRNRARGFASHFADWPELALGPIDFEALRFDRKTEGYKRAIALARLILEKRNPDLSAGKARVFSILFDMNELWEKAVYSRLRKEAALRGGVQVRAQRSKVFWRAEDGALKTVRPDIVVEREDGSRVVVDTKWKLLSNPVPGDQDLKQIFVYDELWGAADGYLVYPLSGAELWVFGRYEGPSQGSERRCSLVSADVDPTEWRKESLLGQLLREAGSG